MNVPTRKAFCKIRAFYILLLLPLLQCYYWYYYSYKKHYFVLPTMFKIALTKGQRGSQNVECRDRLASLIKAIFSRVVFFESSVKILRESRGVTPEVKFARYRNYANCSPVLATSGLLSSTEVHRKRGILAQSHIYLFFSKLKRLQTLIIF